MAQALSVAGALALGTALVVAPAWGLYLTWGLLVPLLPALLLLAPGLWRNLCPIAVLHQVPRRLGVGGGRRPGPVVQTMAPLGAMVGLFVLIPLRPALLNQSGPAVAGLLLGCAALGLAGGLLFAGKSGWCSTFCPMGPVERLYGLDPVLPVAHAHCRGCIRCTAPCMDRGEAGVAAEPARTRPGAPRLRDTPAGIFAAGFPGFILGFFQVGDGPSLGFVYLEVALYTLGSFLLVAAVQALLGYGLPAALRLSAALAAGLYYWFTLPAALAAAQAMWGMGAPSPTLVWAGQAGAVALVGAWLLRGRVRPGDDAPRPRSLPVLPSRPGAR